MEIQHSGVNAFRTRFYQELRPLATDDEECAFGKILRRSVDSCVLFDCVISSFLEMVAFEKLWHPGAIRLDLQYLTAVTNLCFLTCFMSIVERLCE